ncbi:MAG TPA: NAD(P)H-dependent glycerol-3-phosphate dehydrogenase [Firmicutes bacterium]|nr:NAD(P)H-dependent glycerol-3-phosphate dehydrogenase [Bacillota bacterium]
MVRESREHVGIIGAGGWGSALSILLARNMKRVLLWSREREVVEEINTRRTNETFLPGVTFPPGVTSTIDLEYVAGSSTFLILAVPSQFLRSVAARLAPYVRPHHVILHASKGLEQSTTLRMSEVLAQELPHEVHGRIAVLSGPSHAEEVARDIPTAVVTASRSPEIARMAQELLMGPTFRVYTCHDVVGVELGGALKNIIALAAGLSDGLGFGDNTKAALMTRGLAEITRLGVRMGASPMTFAGLSGLGDLIVTCTSMHSRNRRAGIELGRGKPLSEVLSSSPMVIEGVPTTRAACRLADRYGVTMPIAKKLEAVLFEGYDPRQAVSDLMLRDPAHEPEFAVGEATSQG